MHPGIKCMEQTFADCAAGTCSVPSTRPWDGRMSLRWPNRAVCPPYATPDVATNLLPPDYIRRGEIVSQKAGRDRERERRWVHVQCVRTLTLFSVEI